MVPMEHVLNPALAACPDVCPSQRDCDPELARVKTTQCQRYGEFARTTARTQATKGPVAGRAATMSGVNGGLAKDRKKANQHYHILAGRRKNVNCWRSQAMACMRLDVEQQCRQTKPREEEGGARTDVPYAANTAEILSTMKPLLPVEPAHGH